MWNRKLELDRNVYVHESATSKELRVVKELVQGRKNGQFELAVIGMVTEATKYVGLGGLLEYVLMNVLVAQDHPIRIKLADFGVSKPTKGTQAYTEVGTYGYSAPEVWAELDEDSDDPTYTYTSAVDIFSLGCLVYHVLTREIPFGVESFIHVKRYAAGRTPFPETPLLDKGVSLSGRSFLLSLMSPSPRRRPKATLDLIDDWVIPLVIEKPPEKGVGPRLTQTKSFMPQAVAQNDHDRSRFHSASNRANSDNLQVVSETPVTRVPVNISPPIDFFSLQLWNIFNQPEPPEDGIDQFIIFFENGANPDIIYKGCSPIHLAVRETELVSAKPASWLNVLLENGANPNMPDERGQLPLYSIIENKKATSVSLLDALLKSKDNPDRQSVDLNIPDSKGRFPIHILVSTMKWQKSFRYYNKFTDRNPRSILMDMLPKFSRLVASGAQLEAGNRDGLTPLIYACSVGVGQVAKFLVEQGADIHARCPSGLTAFHYLVKFPGLSIMFAKLFLDRGADVNSQDKTGRTPLHHAVLVGDREVLEFLLGYCADINRNDTDGLTALDIAANAENHNGSTINYLVQNGGECNMRTTSVRRRIKRARAWVRMNRALGLKSSTSIERTAGGQQLKSKTSLPTHSKASKSERLH